MRASHPDLLICEVSIDRSPHPLGPDNAPLVKGTGCTGLSRRIRL